MLKKDRSCDSVYGGELAGLKAPHLSAQTREQLSLFYDFCFGLNSFKMTRTTK